MTISKVIYIFLQNDKIKKLAIREEKNAYECSNLPPQMVNTSHIVYVDKKFQKVAYTIY